MPLTLLPASAAAFAPRSAPTIVLNSRVEPWLTQALKRVNRTKRPLNSVTQHYRCLTETLSGSGAIWTLASLMVPRAPDSLLRKDPNLLTEALSNLQFIHIEAYVVHVDMVSQNDVAFKLTIDSINSLVTYHKVIYSADVAASTWDWSGKEQQLKKLQDDFVQAINKYVFRTDVRALEGLEDDGAGELLEGRSQEVKNGILALFLPLLPPPPSRAPEVTIPAPLVPGAPIASQWWQPMQVQAVQQSAGDPWRMMETSASYNDTMGAPWSQSGVYDTHYPSPTLSLNQAFSPPGFVYAPTTSMEMKNAVSMPSILSQQCSTSISPVYDQYSWGHNDVMSQFAIPT